MATIKKTQTAGKKTAFPKSIKPMLATLVKEPFNNDEWIYEVKLDGYRALAFLNNGQVYIQSRNEKSFDEKGLPSDSVEIDKRAKIFVSELLYWINAKKAVVD